MTEDGKRQLTGEERIEARHLLQALGELSRSVRDAMDPQHGVLGLTGDAWEQQWKGMTKELDAFTERVKAGKRAAGGVGDRNARR